jgi:DNA-binding MarR family transcriptional regulator
MVKRDKVLKRIGTVTRSPEVLDHVARDVGVALAAGQRDDLAAFARELAARAPDAGGERDAKSAHYWSGLAAGLGMLLASYEAAFQLDDARAAALRATGSELARAVVLALAAAPATGIELAERLGVTAGATSKILSSLRGAGVARPLGDMPYPKRGARKPHGLTPLGTALADELRASGGVRAKTLSAVG